jgi:DNA repair protein RadC
MYRSYFKAALELGATGLIYILHPSGTLVLAMQINRLLKKLKLAGDSLEIKVWIILIYRS